MEKAREYGIGSSTPGELIRCHQCNYHMSSWVGAMFSANLRLMDMDEAQCNANKLFIWIEIRSIIVGG